MLKDCHPALRQENICSVHPESSAEWLQSVIRTRGKERHPYSSIPCCQHRGQPFFLRHVYCDSKRSVPASVWTCHFLSQMLPWMCGRKSSYADYPPPFHPSFPCEAMRYSLRKNLLPLHHPSYSASCCLWYWNMQPLSRQKGTAPDKVLHPRRNCPVSRSRPYSPRSDVSTGHPQENRLSK